VIELNVYSVLYSLLSRHRIVLLKEVRGERYLPLWIGTNESEAIAMRLQGTQVPRPLTHDLLAGVIGELGGAIQYIVVNDLSDHTFYAKIAVAHNGELRMVDSRPSDAIALAVRVSVPIFADDSVLEKAGITADADIRGEQPPRQSDDLDVFRDFVDSLDLDDLGD